MAVNERNGALVASFPVEDPDQIMLVTDGGQVIRVPVEGIRIVGRGTQGVTIFDTAGTRRSCRSSAFRRPARARAENDDEPGEEGGEPLRVREPRASWGGGGGHPDCARPRKITGGSPMARMALYPGSFDPLTNGHVDMLRAAFRSATGWSWRSACTRRRSRCFRSTTGWS